MSIIFLPAISLQASCDSAEKCVTLSQETSQSLDSTTRAVTTIRDMNLQIACAAKQQTAATEDIKNVTSIRELAELSAAGIAQTTVASDELAKVASDLQNSISWFVVANK